jgi:hypothetical protein
MVSDLFFYQLVLIALLWLCLMLHWAWPSDRAATSSTPLHPTASPRRRSTAPTPFTGLVHKPLCDACEQASDSRPKAPGVPPPLITSTRGRKRRIDTS